MTLDLPENIRRLVEERQKQHGHPSPEAYISSLVLADPVPDTRPTIPDTREELEAMLMEGMKGPFTRWYPGYYTRKAQAMRDRATEEAM